MRRIFALAAVTLALLTALPTDAATGRRRRSRRPLPPPPLVWHVESLDGDIVASNEADAAINPASVVKVATTMWAIERLGPEFRFETRFFASGELDPAKRALRGSLVVQGTGDPDFHAENAFLVAQSLNRLGVTQVTGPLVVNQRFWMGWENGSEGTSPNVLQRSLTMAGRLRQALDPRRWNGQLRRTWREFAAARGLPVGRPFRVAVLGGVGADGEAPGGELLLVHRSEPISTALRRFNCFSANDIERVGTVIGPPEELAGVVATRCGVPSRSVQLATTSGLGSNRVSPRTIVRMMREFRATCERNGVPIEGLLPVSGCDPSTVTASFPHLSSGANFASVVAKTGTLTNTDGGVAVLAGFASTASGEYVFCVAAPGAQGRVKAARGAEERFLLALLAEHGGAVPRSCGSPLPGPDAEAGIILVSGQ